MTLEAVIEDKAKIPEGLQSHYVEVDGKFVLDVPGMKTQEDFDRYADALKKRYTDAGADFARKHDANLTREDVAQIVADGLKKFDPKGGTPPDGKTGNGQDGEVAQRLHDLERTVASLKGDNEKLQQERDKALSQSRDTTIRNQLTEAAGKSGVIPEAVPNLVTLASQNFEVTQDGSVVTKLDAGEGISPNQKPADFFANLSRNPSFRNFWPASQGSGADPGRGPGGGGGDLGKSNPWSKAGWNMTEQGKLYQSNRQEAERLMEVAGVKLGATGPVR